MVGIRREEGPVAALPWAILLFGAIVWYTIVYHTRFQLEDALITYRYSANILAGHGFVYNPGERVLGTTTPLLTLLLALVSWPFGPHMIREVATFVMPLFGLAAGLAVFFALAEAGISRITAALAMLLLYTQIPFVRTGIGGMETPVVLLLMGLSLWTLCSGRAVMTGVFCGLLVFCRIDGCIWAAILMLALGLKSWRKAALAVLLAMAIALPWFVLAQLYFGSLLPNTILAKTVTRPGKENVLLTGQYMLRYALWYVRGTGFHGKMLFFVPWVGIIALGARRLLLQNARDLWPLMLFPFLHALALYAARAPKFEWYLIPITYACTMMLALGTVDVCRWIGRLIPAPARAPAAALLVLAALVSYCALSVPAMIRRMSPLATKEDYVRTEVGKWLRDSTPEDASVAMEAIGYQGYYSGRRIVDFAGLVTPEVVEFRGNAGLNGEVFDRVLRRFRPDYIVLRSFEVDNNDHFSGGLLFMTPEKERFFHKTYREVRRFHAPGSRPDDELFNVTVYARARGRQ